MHYQISQHDYVIQQNKNVFMVRHMNTCTHTYIHTDTSLVPRPRPVFHRSDGKLGGAWERGYTDTACVQHVNVGFAQSCPNYAQL